MNSVFIINAQESALNFKGNNGYASTQAFLENRSAITFMAWIKPANGGNKDRAIAFEDKAFQIYLSKGKKPAFSISINGNHKHTIIGKNIKINQWSHISGSFNGDSGEMRLYVNGELVKSKDLNAIGGKLKSSNHSNSKFDIGRSTINNNQVRDFKGDIDEVRIFDKFLSTEQIKQLVFQEIDNDNGVIKGAIVPKPITDYSTYDILYWEDLLAYYPMNDINSLSSLRDYSNQDRYTQLKKATIAQQSAPIPFITKSNGSWNKQNTWLHGQIWDIEKLNDDIDWRIVQIDHKITLNKNATLMGLAVSNNASLTVNGSRMLDVSGYLKLNGELDLKKDSQLIQGINSDLETSLSGKLKRRQKGNSNFYHFKYWASPVGKAANTSIADDNANSNNPNNTPFSLSMIKDKNGNPINFTSNNHETNKISTKWLYTYKNGNTYSNWLNIAPNTDINAGNGYIHKGTKQGNGKVEFTFEGKPNNGTIKLNAIDVGGQGSEPNSTMTSYLVGNPYPSTIDLYKFIDDNQGIIDGTVRMWQQWAGNSHILADYEGGYAEVNKMGSIRAYQFNGIAGGRTNEQLGTLKPTRYISVGQGFMVEVIDNGKIEFNNGQRVFVKQNDANGNFNVGTISFRTREENAQADKDDFSKIRLEFNHVDGPMARRELLLGFSSRTSKDYDYGYDSKLTSESNADDLTLTSDFGEMTMQAYSEINSEKTIPLTFVASGEFNYSIQATEFINIEADKAVYLKDNLNGNMFDLRSGSTYTFSSQAGEFKERFVIVFKAEKQTLDNKDFDIEETSISIFYSNQNSKLFVNGLDKVEEINIINMLGQNAYKINSPKAQTLANGILVNGLNTGAYIVSVASKENGVINKKFVVK